VIGPTNGQPDRPIDRRTALRVGTALFAGLVVPGRLLGRPASSPATPWPPPISLAQWSVHRLHFWGRLDNLDFAPLARSAFGIDAVEYVNQFFADRGRDAAYLSAMRRRADDHGVRGVLIMVDHEGRLGDPDERRRRRAVDRHRVWVEAARQLGCSAIRVNAHGEGSPEEQLVLAADGLRRLTEFAATCDVDVLVENHGGCSWSSRWLARLIRTVDHERCGSLPDFGNFVSADGRRDDPYDAVRRLMPSAGGVSAKTRDFDDAGEERSIDFRRMLRIIADAGYTGHVGIEYEGRRLGELEGVRRSKALLERAMAAVAGGTA
jgi:sugar phosphate isomerase/epimerase